MSSSADRRDVEFTWTTEKQYHINRQKQMLAKYGKEIRPLMGYDYFTVCVAWIPVATQMIAMLYAPEMSWFWYIFTAWVIGGTCNQSMFLLIHELSHYTAFKAQWKSDALAIFANIPIGLPYAMTFKAYHQDHHRYLGVDGYDSDLPCRVEAALLSNLPGKIFFLAFQVLFYAIRPMLVRPPARNRAVAANWVAQFGFDAIVIYFFGIQPIIYLLASSFLACCFHPMAGHFIAEHYIHVFNPGCNQETYSYYGPMNVFGWNVGYHNEHHDFPNIPWTRLPQLRKIAPEFYEPLVKCESWPGTLWSFLTDSRVNLYSRLKRQPIDVFVEKSERMG